MTQITINLENLKSNIRNLKSLIKNTTQFMAVVKANAYGHGLIECAKASIESGANWLGVVQLSEAIALRQANIFKPILILGYVDVKEARKAANQDISIPVVSTQHARELADIGFDKPLKVHLKVDTGLNRLGLEVNEIIDVIHVLRSNRGIRIEGVYSHFASVEENDLDFAKQQVNEFKKSIKILKDLGYENILKHMAATSATLILPDSHFDMVRCGIGIYGLWPSTEIKKKFARDDFFSPVLSFKTEIIQRKKIASGEKIGYGCNFTAERDMTIGIIPVGYHEGLDRGLSNCGEVLVLGTRCPIIGRICMNMTIIDISKLKTQISKLNSEATIIGKDGDEEITADEIAEKLGTINYEIVTHLPEHLERRYI